MMCIVLLFVNIINIPKIKIDIETTAKAPPIEVKSDFVVQAYNVRAKNIPRVINVAINTIRGFEKPQIKPTMYP